MPTTARSHFDDDISRAWAMHALGVTSEPADEPLALDVGRVAVAFGVGALDAYLCDAFTDTLARCLKSCRQNGHRPPNAYGKLELPVGPLMTDYAVRNNWGLRMAARALMERDNLLQLGRLKDLLNPALPTGHKLWNDLAQDYVDLDRKRLAGIRKSQYAALTGQAKADEPKKVSAAVIKRMGEIVQRRHDVVHNCDRPKTAKQPITLSMAKKMLTDVEDFIAILDDHRRDSCRAQIHQVISAVRSSRRAARWSRVSSDANSFMPCDSGESTFLWWQHAPDQLLARRGG